MTDGMKCTGGLIDGYYVTWSDDGLYLRDMLGRQTGTYRVRERFEGTRRVLWLEWEDAPVASEPISG